MTSTSENVFHPFISALSAFFTREEQNILLELLKGTIILPSSSFNAIWKDGEPKMALRTFYLRIHQILEKFGRYQWEILRKIQRFRRFRMISRGILIVDEHVISVRSQKIQGTGKLFCPAEKKKINGFQIISLHYQYGRFDYPIGLILYYQREYFEKNEEFGQFKTKNQLTYELLRTIFQFPNCPQTICMDRGFCDKKIYDLCNRYHKTFVNCLKRNWTVTVRKSKYSVEQLGKSLQDSDFALYTIRNRKTGNLYRYYAAEVVVYVPKLKQMKIVYSYCAVRDSNGNYQLDRRENLAFFLTNDLSASISRVLTDYKVRWAIETGYRELNQHLGLNHSFLRTTSERSYFIIFLFLASMALVWVHTRYRKYSHDWSLGNMKKHVFFLFFHNISLVIQSDWVNLTVFSNTVV